MNTQRRAVRGFTLLEVLVALAVLAISLGAVIRVASHSTATVSQLRERTLAAWVASNAINELLLSASWPPPGNRQGSELMAGQAWYWQMQVVNTDDPELRRLEVSVSPTEQGESAATLVAFIGEPGD